MNNLNSIDEIRKLYLKKRNSQSAEDIRSKSLKAVERIISLNEFKAAHNIFIYNHIRSELSLESLVSHPLSKDKVFAYPVCTGAGKMEALLPSSWVKGAFGITEPDIKTSTLIRPEELDLIICPGAAFDDKCHRLGMGGGYYDRFLPKCKNAFIIMAAFELQHANNLPVQKWDVSMDMIVTESRIIQKTNYIFL